MHNYVANKLMATKQLATMIFCVRNIEKYAYQLPSYQVTGYIFNVIAIYLLKSQIFSRNVPSGNKYTTVYVAHYVIGTVLVTNTI